MVYEPINKRLLSFKIGELEMLRNRKKLTMTPTMIQLNWKHIIIMVVLFFILMFGFGEKSSFYLIVFVHKNQLFFFHFYSWILKNLFFTHILKNIVEKGKLLNCSMRNIFPPRRTKFQGKILNRLISCNVYGWIIIS